MGADSDGDESVKVGAQLPTLYDEHYRQLVKLASFYLDDVESSEEVVQDAFVALLSRRRQITSGAEAAYLRSAVLNGARSQLRKRQVRGRKGPWADRPVPSPEDEALGRASGQRLLSAVRQLSRGQADVIVLRYYLDLSEAEIAATLGIARGTVKSHASRGLARLAQLLEADR